ncbi:MAG: ABC transporter permease [uncultured bacterium]|nr:MAG: ABC transporter permease [uncultured bacterium]
MNGSKLFASIAKELLLLIRDRAGMVLLFVMPAFMVIVMTLIQEKVTTTTVDVLFVDNDRGKIGAEVRGLFGRIDTIRLVERLEGKELSAEKVHSLVAAGKYQFGLILPQGLSEGATEGARIRVTQHLFPDRGTPSIPAIPEILVWFDPTVHGSFRAAVHSALDQVVKGVQAQLFVEHSLTLLPEKIGEGMNPQMMQAFSLPKLSAGELLPQLFEETTLIPVAEHFTTAMGFTRQPTAVQQNVPAWAIFGIFFIVVPLAGSLIKERESGTLLRLRVLPVSYLTVMAGKIAAYALVCLIQFGVIIGAGIFILPLFGVAAFDPGSEPLLFALVLTGIIAAACGYGILLGTVGRTYEQIAVFAPVSIVIGAAIGGIMVPVYALPDFLRPVCLISPLYWGQSGFYDLLLRGGDLRAILPETLALLAFGLGTTLCAWLYSARKRKRP